MKKYFVAVLIVMVVVMFSYLNNFAPTIEKSLVNKNVQFSEIVAEEDLEEGILVYYYNEFNQSYASALVTKSLWGYKWLSSFGNWSVSSKDEIVWQMSNRQIDNGFDFDFYIAQGIINNDEIDKILISLNNSNKNIEANIVNGELIKFWYFISDTPLDGSPKLIGLTKDNLEIYNSRE